MSSAVKVTVIISIHEWLIVKHVCQQWCQGEYLSWPQGLSSQKTKRGEIINDKTEKKKVCDAVALRCNIVHLKIVLHKYKGIFLLVFVFVSLCVCVCVCFFFVDVSRTCFMWPQVFRKDWANAVQVRKNTWIFKVSTQRQRNASFLMSVQLFVTLCCWVLFCKKINENSFSQECLKTLRNSLTF